MIKEHDQVVLTGDLPRYQLTAGDLGVIVMIHGDHAGYELEFFTADGQTLDVVTVEAAQVRSVDRHAILHAQQIAV